MKADLAEQRKLKLNCLPEWVVQSWGWINGTFCYRILEAGVPDVVLHKNRVKECFIRAREKREREHLEIQEIGSNTKQMKRKSPGNAATHLDPENSQSRWGCRNGTGRNGTKSKKKKKPLDVIERMFFLTLAQFVDDTVINTWTTKQKF